MVHYSHFTGTSLEGNSHHSNTVVSGPIPENQPQPVDAKPPPVIVNTNDIPATATPSPTSFVTIQPQDVIDQSQNVVNDDLPPANDKPSTNQPFSSKIPYFGNALYSMTSTVTKVTTEKTPSFEFDLALPQTDEEATTTAPAPATPAPAQTTTPSTIEITTTRRRPFFKPMFPFKARPTFGSTCPAAMICVKSKLGQKLT